MTKCYLIVIPYLVDRVKGKRKNLDAKNPNHKNARHYTATTT